MLEDDSLSVLRTLPSESVDLIYIDPPFGTGQLQRLQSIRLGVGEKTRRGFGDLTHRFEVQSDHEYRDDMPLDEYLVFLDERLKEAWRVLKHTGSLYLHLDFHSVHYARLLLDDIFGSDRFLNEIIWAYDYGGRPRDKWPRKHDNILWYSKSDSWMFNREDIDRIPYMAPGLVGPEKAAKGKLPTDVWWMTIVPTNSHERTGYPTQKPVKLLERIIVASSRPGDVVMDFFAGSGTTGVAARRLGRHFVLVDINPLAVEIANKRLNEVPEPSPQLFEASS
ncbi:MAG: site-specific DNA-methyltransferase [Actinomycetota bacterium]|nr:site-specific DNA-methyltransferase [Actinomycetota bacterium]